MVSRETSARLSQFAALVRKWNPKINLVSPKTLDDLEARHIADSQQVFEFSGVTGGHWVDLGSGGGFPGLVVAICAAEKAPDLKLTLVESDQRKSAFLMTAARELGLQVQVLAQRIEAVPPLQADIISARALAPLTDLLWMTERHLASGGIAIFPKGERHAIEVEEAQKTWRFDMEMAQSCTEDSARLLKLRNIQRGRAEP